jgi:6-phosphogluconolactonase
LCFVKRFELLSFASADELARAAASTWLDEIEKAHHAGKLHCVALSGGRIAHNFFASVVEQAQARRIKEGGLPSLPSNVHFFWADERCVPPTDPESNFKMADEFLFEPLKIQKRQIHRIPGEEPPEAAAKGAESELRQIAPSNEAGQPVLDLIFLGMGEDGHVASLFPGAPAEIVHCAAPLLIVEDSPKPPPRRISLSYAAIAAAKQVWVLISGAGKEGALAASLNLSGQTPLAKVIKMRQKTLIFSQIEAGKKN